MKKENSRINLTPQAAASLSEMLGSVEMGNKCVKLTASGLVSWIVLQFRKNHFEKQKEAIAQAHFDRRAYLKSVLKGVTDDESMDEALKFVLGKRTPKRRKKEGVK